MCVCVCVGCACVTHRSSLLCDSVVTSYDFTVSLGPSNTTHSALPLLNTRGNYFPILPCSLI